MRDSTRHEGVPSACSNEDQEPIPPLPMLDGNFLRYPNVLVDFWQRELPLAQFALLNFLVRQTLGFNRSAVSMSEKRFREGSGVVARSTWLTARDALLDRGLIGRRRRRNDQGDRPTIFWIDWSTLLETPARTDETTPRPVLSVRGAGFMRAGGRFHEGGGTDETGGKGAGFISTGGPVSSVHEIQIFKNMMKNSSKDMGTSPVAAAAALDVPSDRRREAAEALDQLGLGGDAETLIDQHGTEHVLSRIAAFGARAKAAKNTAGFIRRSMDWELPKAYVRQQARRQTTTAEANATHADAEAYRQATETHAAWRASVEAHMADLDDDMMADLLEQAEARAEQYGRVSHTFVQIALRELVGERFGFGAPPQLPAKPAGLHLAIKGDGE